MTGVIEGGTEFVIAAYVVTALVLGGYTARVLLAFRSACAAARQANGPCVCARLMYLGPRGVRRPLARSHDRNLPPAV
jgi:hypothetical protein